MNVFSVRPPRIAPPVCHGLRLKSVPPPDPEPTPVPAPSFPPVYPAHHPAPRGAAAREVTGHDGSSTETTGARDRQSDPPPRGTSSAYLISARHEPIKVDWDAAPSAEELDECDFIEVYEVDIDDLGATNEVRACAQQEAQRLEPVLPQPLLREVTPLPAEPPLSVRPPVIVRPEPELRMTKKNERERIDPASARYIVSPGSRAGEVILRALGPGEPPPFGIPIAKLAPSCDLDTRCIATMLNRWW